MSRSKGRGKWYPPFPRKKQVWRTLAIWMNVHPADEYRILDIDGVIHSVHDFEEFISVMFDNDLLLFIDDFLKFPFTDDVIRTGEIECSEKGKPICGFVRRDKQIRWISASHHWDEPRADEEFLHNAYDLFEHCGVGTYPTRGSLADAIYDGVIKR